MTFVRLKNQISVRLADVISASSKDTDGLYTLTLRSGATYRVSFDAWYAALALSSYAVLPAAEGTYEVFACGSGADTEAVKVPVLGWLIDAFGEPRPITANNRVFDREGVYTILHPDGSVDDPMGQHPNLESWVAEQRAADWPPPPGARSSIH